MMSFFDTIKNIDRRIIFLFIAFSVIVPLLFNVVFPEKLSPIVGKIFDKIESLPEGSRVLISLDYDPSSAPEQQPMVDAIIYHCCARNLRLYIMALWPPGQNIASTTIERIIVKHFPEKVHGEDYVHLGYKAGNEGLINVIITDMKKMYTTDAAGTVIDSIPAMRDVRNLKNMDLIVAFGGGKPGLKEWILFAGDPGNIPVAGGVTAVSAPLLYPYYPNQMLGMMGGIKGAAEYEAEMSRHYEGFAQMKHPGLEMMGPQAVAHVVIMLFIIIGNITFFIDRKRGEAKGLGLDGK
jgi:hypothetical protein